MLNNLEMLISNAEPNHGVQDYDLGQIIGRGGFARVYRARHRLSGTEVAIKVIEKEKMEQMKMTERVQSEIKIHSSLAPHPNIVRALTSFEDENCYYLVMELCPKGNFYRYLKRKGRLSEAETRHVIHQLLQALSHLHAFGVIHRDLKLSNILIVDDCEGESQNLNASTQSPMDAGEICVRSSQNSVCTISSGSCFTDYHSKASQDSMSSCSFKKNLPKPKISIKLCDFGLAALMEHPDEEHYTLCGTPNYIAPEIASHNPHAYPADMWSVGCLFYTMIVGHPPFEEAASSQSALHVPASGIPYNNAPTSPITPSQRIKLTLDRIVAGVYVIPEDVPLTVEGRTVLRALLSMNPAARRTAADILRDPYLAGDHASDCVKKDCQKSENEELELDAVILIDNYVAFSPQEQAKGQRAIQGGSTLPTPIAHHSSHFNTKPIPSLSVSNSHSSVAITDVSGKNGAEQQKSAHTESPAADKWECVSLNAADFHALDDSFHIQSLQIEPVVKTLSCGDEIRPRHSEEPSLISATRSARGRLHQRQELGLSNENSAFVHRESLQRTLNLSQYATQDWGRGRLDAVQTNGLPRAGGDQNRPGNRALVCTETSPVDPRGESYLSRASSRPYTIVHSQMPASVSEPRRTSVSSSWMAQIQLLRSSMSRSAAHVSASFRESRENVAPGPAMLSSPIHGNNRGFSTAHNRIPLSAVSQSTGSSLTASSTSTMSFAGPAGNLLNFAARSIWSSDQFPQASQGRLLPQQPQERAQAVRHLWSVDAAMLNPFCYATPDNELIILTKERDVMFGVPVMSRHGKSSFARLFLSHSNPLTIRVGRSTSKVNKEISALLTKHGEKGSTQISDASVFSAVYSSVSSSIIDSESSIHAENLWIHEHCLSNLTPAIEQAYHRVCEILRIIKCRVPRIILYLSSARIAELIEAEGDFVNVERHNSGKRHSGNDDDDEDSSVDSAGDSRDTNNSKRIPLSMAVVNNSEISQVNEVSMFTITTSCTNATSCESGSAGNGLASDSTPHPKDKFQTKVHLNQHKVTDSDIKANKPISDSTKIEMKCMLMSNFPMPDFCAQWADGTYLRYSLCSGAMIVDCPIGQPARYSLASRLAGIEAAVAAGGQLHAEGDILSHAVAGECSFKLSDVKNTYKISNSDSSALDFSGKDDSDENCRHAKFVAAPVHFEGKLDEESGELVGLNMNRRVKGYVRIAQVALKKTFSLQNDVSSGLKSNETIVKVLS